MTHRWMDGWRDGRWINEGWRAQRGSSRRGIVGIILVQRDILTDGARALTHTHTLPF